MRQTHGDQTRPVWRLSGLQRLPGLQAYPIAQWRGKFQEYGGALSGTGLRRRDRGEILQAGQNFYGCNRYPECSFASWDKPVAIPCPVCGSPYLLEKTTKRDGTQYVCPNRECGYRQPAGDTGGSSPAKTP
nr:type I DNA topoisomerase [Desulfosarcina cetonica]